MIVDILGTDYRTVESLDADPSCGEDFCDSCSDCLHCYWEDPCYGGGSPRPGHSWYVYADRAEAWRASHPEARTLGEGSDG